MASNRGGKKLKPKDLGLTPLFPQMAAQHFRNKPQREHHIMMNQGSSERRTVVNGSKKICRSAVHNAFANAFDVREISFTKIFQDYQEDGLQRSASFFFLPRKSVEERTLGSLKTWRYLRHVVTDSVSVNLSLSSSGGTKKNIPTSCIFVIRCYIPQRVVSNAL